MDHLLLDPVNYVGRAHTRQCRRALSATSVPTDRVSPSELVAIVDSHTVRALINRFLNW
jgi:hypothetical protein